MVLLTELSIAFDVTPLRFFFAQLLVIGLERGCFPRGKAIAVARNNKGIPVYLAKFGGISSELGPRARRESSGWYNGPGGFRLVTPAFRHQLSDPATRHQLSPCGHGRRQ